MPFFCPFILPGPLSTGRCCHADRDPHRWVHQLMPQPLCARPDILRHHCRAPPTASIILDAGVPCCPPSPPRPFPCLPSPTHGPLVSSSSELDVGRRAEGRPGLVQHPEFQPDQGVTHAGRRGPGRSVALVPGGLLLLPVSLRRRDSMYSACLHF